MFTRHEIPFDTPLLPAFARLLLDACGDRLPRALILLPSTRACGSLRHALLEASGREGVLLPRILTPAGLVEELAGRMDDLAPPAVPRALRAAVLEPRLADVDWLRGRAGAAWGMAEELVRIFDELRRHGLDPGDLDGGGATAPELQQRDVARVREAWRLYREAIPRDGLDREREVVDFACAAERWPAPPVGDLFVAGFSDLPPLTTRLIRAAARAAAHAHLVGVAPGENPLTRLYLAAFSDRDAPTHPLTPDRQVAAALTGRESEPLGRDERPYPDRLSGLGDADAILAPGGEPLLRPCADPEQESRLVADLVITRLREDPRSRIAVATADRALARRIADQLADAGMDLDATGGEPLSAHAAGRLVWALLRTALTDLHPEPLLELLTHPLVDFGRGRSAHGRRTLTLERDLLRGRTAGVGLDALRARAVRRDTRLREKLPDVRPEMTELVDDVAGALGSLLALAKGEPAPVADHLAALREAWDRAAPEDPLSVPAEFGVLPDPSWPARRELHRLLADLDAVAAALPPLSFRRFAAMLSRLLAATEWRPHRSVHLPVQVTGLLEARLETYDLLVVAGLGESVFPDEPRRRTLLLGRSWRERNGLPDWRQDLGLDAELLLRLLHNGKRVVVTWSREQDGRPALPSPLLGRLMLATARPPDAAPRAPLWRRAAAAADDPDADQAIFATEPRARPVHARSADLACVSHKALRAYLDCPYRFLLQWGFRLSEPEVILEELRKLDYGRLAHEALARFLREDGPGVRALAARDRDGALTALHDDARVVFADAIDETSRRRLWEAAFLAMAADIVGHELSVAGTRRCIAREQPFAFTLGELHAWLSARGAAPPGLDDALAAIACEGRIDRVDLGLGGDIVHVIDYKTGDAPTKKSVATGEDLQLAIYALAVRLGKVPGAPPEAELAGAYYGLKPDAVGFDPGKPHLGPGHDLVRDGAALLAAATAMADRDRDFDLVPPDTVPDHKDAPCKHCPWRGACRVEEPVFAASAEAAS
jgi:ATP-dependent helicase/nuclease subunit B